MTEEKNKGGRPYMLDPKKLNYKQIYKFCLLGSTDAELADFLGIAESTLHNYKFKLNKDGDRVDTKLMKTIRKGREIADANVANSLYKRACGFSHEDTHISAYQGDITETPIIKHYPPDTPAATAWLNNRRRERWGNTQGEDGKTITIEHVLKQI